MQDLLLSLLSCPVTRTPLRLEVISRSSKELGGVMVEVVDEGILHAADGWFYPVIKGVPRLLIEAFIDHEPFLRKHLPDYTEKRAALEQKYHGLLRYVVKKNSHTKQSFSQEWKVFDYDNDKVWNADKEQLLQRFLKETAETSASLSGKLVLDAGCGNGLLNQFIAQAGAVVLGLDLSLGIEMAYQQNKQPHALFVQGDVQFPPVLFEQFDIVHCSGVLIHTNNAELSFSCIDACVKEGGKMSVWLYHPRKEFSHNLFNFIRKFTSKLPLTLQYYLYAVTLLPVSFVIKRIKGNKQNVREMMVDILDWFTPEFRSEHEPDEVRAWFYKRRYDPVQVTTMEHFGFNMTGVKKHTNPLKGLNIWR